MGIEFPVRLQIDVGLHLADRKNETDLWADTDDAQFKGAHQQSTGISFRWRPFHLLIILQEMNHVPFADKPAKSAYMWRDIERRAAMYGLSVTLPRRPIPPSSQ